MIDGEEFFDQSKKDLKTLENIRKIATGQGDDCITGLLDDYPYFKENHKFDWSRCK